MYTSVLEACGVQPVFPLLVGAFIHSFIHSESVHTPSIASVASTALGSGGSEMNKAHSPQEGLVAECGRKAHVQRITAACGEHPVEIFARERSRESAS